MTANLLDCIGSRGAKDARDEQLWAYFNALQRAQREIDVAKELYQHNFLKELTERYHLMFDYRRAGIGERLIFERAHRWMVDWDLFPKDQIKNTEYDKVMVV